MIVSSLDLKFLDSQNEITGNPILMAPELICDVDYETISLSINVYSYAILLYSMFSNSKFEISDNRPIRSPYRLQMRISHGYRYKRPNNIPDHYWELINACWDENPNGRPTFEEITNILKDDKFALEEFQNSIDIE